MPETKWLLYAENVPAPLCRKPGGSYMAEDDTGEKIEDVLDRAPGNHAAIGGIKVITKSGWFAARPSGTEDIYKIYAESFRGEAHLTRIVDEAQAMVDDTLEAQTAELDDTLQ